jgi:hypothetical protein
LGPWSDREIATRVLLCHARLLAAEEAALEGTLARLRALGLSEERVGGWAGRAGGAAGTCRPPSMMPRSASLGKTSRCVLPRRHHCPAA